MMRSRRAGTALGIIVTLPLLAGAAVGVNTLYDRHRFADSAHRADEVMTAVRAEIPAFSVIKFTEVPCRVKADGPQVCFTSALDPRDAADQVHRILGQQRIDTAVDCTRPAASGPSCLQTADLGGASLAALTSRAEDAASTAKSGGPSEITITAVPRYLKRT